jgi:hypothetical protein
MIGPWLLTFGCFPVWLLYNQSISFNRQHRSPSLYRVSCPGALFFTFHWFICWFCTLHIICPRKMCPPKLQALFELHGVAIPKTTSSWNSISYKYSGWRDVGMLGVPSGRTVRSGCYGYEALTRSTRMHGITSLKMEAVGSSKTLINTYRCIREGAPVTYNNQTSRLHRLEDRHVPNCLCDRLKSAAVNTELETCDSSVAA